MPWQSEMFAPDAPSITPTQGATAPRLWIRRLVIWDAPGGEAIRDIALRPGLNIIWSPDPSEQSGEDSLDVAALGHGSGKTLLCRLLRYCLGEARFASDDLLRAIRHRFKDGMVGAEVMLCEQLWLVIRPIGLGNRNIAVPAGDGETLDALSVDDRPATGIAPLVEAIVDQIISPPIAALVPMRTNKSPWLVALAWLARDQECRFGHALEWRDPQSQTQSPAQGMSKTNALNAIRAFANAIDPEESRRREDARRLQALQAKKEAEQGHLRWQILRLRARLSEATGVSRSDIELGPLCVDVLRERVAEMRKAAMQGGVQDAERIRTAHTEALVRQAELRGQRSEVESAVTATTERIQQLEGDLAGAGYAKMKADEPLCPVCEVPIDRVLAEGCGLSHTLPDLESVRRRHERLLDALQSQQARRAGLTRRGKELTALLETTDRETAKLAQSLAEAETAAKARDDAWYKVRRAADDVEHLKAAYDELQASASEIDQLKQQVTERLDQAKALREKHETVYRQWERRFDGVVRALIHSARGKVQVDGNGLALTIDMGGDRSTAAIESIKVIAFDLAILCMGIEGQTHLPALLIHDSPREADLGLSVYHKLFYFARSLEELSATPLFQYVITTTTPPPLALGKAPWLVQRLGGAPASKRLLRQDL